MLLLYKGINGQVELSDNNVVIKRKGFMAVMSKGFTGDKTIPIKAITAIQVKPASLLSGNGFIKFCYGGSDERRGNLAQAAKDDNAVIFGRKSNKDFEELKSRIEKLIYEPKDNPQSNNISIADEIEKLSRLKNEGIITSEQFEKKKNDLLNM